MKIFYHGSKCAVSVDGVLSEFFEIHSGVRQDFFRSPLLFGIVMYWIVKTSMKTFDLTFDLDFSNDNIILEDSWEGIQTATSALEEAAKRFELVINVAKTKVITVGIRKSKGK